MAFIWSEEALERLFRHRSQHVQEWAIRMAFELYPETLADKAVALIPSAPGDTVKLILVKLGDMDAPVADLGPLADLSRTNAGPEVKRLASAILLRSGYASLPHKAELAAAASFPHIVGSAERGFGLVMEAYRASGRDNGAILDGIAGLCGFDGIFGELAGARGEKETKKRVKYFERLWGKVPPGLERLSQTQMSPDDAGKARAGANAGDGTLWKQDLLAELEEEKERLSRVYEVARGRAFGSSLPERMFLEALGLCAARNETGRRLLEAASDAEELLGAVVMKPWRGVPGQALLDFLRSARPEHLVAAVSKALDNDYSYASYVFNLLNAVEAPGRFELFLEIFEGEKHGKAMAEEAGEALKCGGTQAADHILEYYPRMPGNLRTLVLFVLDALPTPQVVDFLLKHFDEYMSSQDSDEFVDCLGEIASAEFLAPLVREWKTGETVIGRAVKLISEIHDISNDQVREVVQATESEVRRLQRPDRPISSFPLRCTGCGRTYHYQLKNIYLGKGGDPAIGDIIQCKGCGGIETYELTARARFGFTAELLRIVAMKEAAPKKDLEDIDTPFRLGEHVTMQALGQNVKNASEAYHVLKAELEKHSGDSRLQRRMGNVLRNGGRSDLGLPYYLEALRLDPNDAESCAVVADIFMEQKRYNEAIPYLERLVPLCRESSLDERMRRDIFGLLLKQTAIVQEKTGHKIELFPPAMPQDVAASHGVVTLHVRTFDPSKPEDFDAVYQAFRHGRMPGSVRPEMTVDAVHEGPGLHLPVRAGPKVGRNDPCPCGSGKKYKKCCGR